jgi:hypothetical protein
VLKVEQRFQIARAMAEHKGMGFVVHHRQQFPALADDRNPLSPGQDRGKQSADLDVLLFTEGMRDRNGIVRDERRLVVVQYFLVEKVLPFKNFVFSVQGHLVVTGYKLQVAS